MPFSRKLKAPIALDDGRTIATLADARALMMGLPERHLVNGHWQYAGDLVLKAAEPEATEDDLAVATQQLLIALRAEGAIERVPRPVASRKKPRRR